MKVGEEEESGGECVDLEGMCRDKGVEEACPCRVKHLFLQQAQCFIYLKEHTKTSEPVVLGLIRMRIEELVFRSRLKKMDKRMKRQYQAQFPPDIPHISELPTNVYHHIQVKPLAKTTVA